MTILQRVKNGFMALIMILCGLLMLLDAEHGVRLAAGILSVFLVIKGIQMFFFYFTMARHMVGGKAILIQAIIVMDFGIVTVTTLDFPKTYLIIYLLAIYFVSGIIEILRAREAKDLGAGSWKRTMSSGIVTIAFVLAALAGGILMNSPWLVAWIFALSLFYSAAVRLSTVFRKSAIVYIP